MRNDVYSSEFELLKNIAQIANQRAFELKNNEQAAEIISWRYNLRLSQVQNWLIETNWNFQNKCEKAPFQLVIDYLLKLNLIEESEADFWEEKLF